MTEEISMTCNKDEVRREEEGKSSEVSHLERPRIGARTVDGGYERREIAR